MQIKELAHTLLTCRIIGDETARFTGIETDSRKVASGDLFVCITGLIDDGHEYATQAVANGAAALVVERILDIEVPQLLVPDSRYALPLFSSHYYGYPSTGMKVIGVTGTNGKTTTSFIIEHILCEHGFRTGLMGTIRMKIGNEYTEMERTTQESLDLQRHFQRMREVGTDYCVMEVSSHALDMGRVRGIRFRSGIFTNLTQDHLDYHQTMEQYHQAKSLLFSRMDNTYEADMSRRQFAVLNADDPAHTMFKQVTSAQIITYGIDNECDVRASNISITAQGTEFLVTTFAGESNIRMKLVGKFNVYNALAAIASTLAEGLTLSSIRDSLETLTAVDGRMEVVDAGQDFLVLVDYAHTPDGLRNALSTIHEFAEGKIITVFGCGGDRDRTKRPIMGQIATEYSDKIYVTSDNPRTENPEAIVQDIAAGIEAAGWTSDQYELIVNRQAAIERAIAEACPKDVVLIAGKGHETYQIIGKTKHDFDDREVARTTLRSRGL